MASKNPDAPQALKNPKVPKAPRKPAKPKAPEEQASTGEAMPAPSATSTIMAGPIQSLAPPAHPLAAQIEAVRVAAEDPQFLAHMHAPDLARYKALHGAALALADAAERLG